MFCVSLLENELLEDRNNITLTSELPSARCLIHTRDSVDNWVNNGNLLQYSRLENPMDRGAWWVAVHGVARSQTRWATSLSLFTFMHWRRKWQPTPVFLPGKSLGWGAWWAAISGVAQSRTRLKRLSSSSSRDSVDNWVNKLCKHYLTVVFRG